MFTVSSVDAHLIRISNRFFVGKKRIVVLVLQFPEYKHVWNH